MEFCFKQTAISIDALVQTSVRQYFLGIMQKAGVFFSWIRKVGDSSSSELEQGGKRRDASGKGTKDSKEKQNEYLRGVLDKHGNRILRLAYSYVHNMEDSEEILQDVLLKLIGQAPAFESAEHEKAWILRVTANLSKNRIEYNKLRDTDELNEELVAEKKEDLSFIWEAVKSLPENYREVIHLFYEEGYQTEEIAGILGESGANIRTRLKRAREKLKEILKEEYDFDE